MEINFNYFAPKQVAEKNVDDLTAKPYELDLQPVNHAIQNGNGPRLQGGSGFLCHATEESVCTHCCATSYECAK